MTNELSSKIVKEYGLDTGASVVGIASAKDFGPAPDCFEPSDNLESCASVIVLGAPISQKAILDDSAIGFFDIRNALNEKMTDIAKKWQSELKKCVEMCTTNELDNLPVFAKKKCRHQV